MRPHPSKLELRDQIKSRLSLITPDERATTAIQIRDQLIATDLYQSSTTILAYASLPSELDLDPFIHQALANSKRVCIPKIDWDDKSMHPLQLRSLESDLQLGRYGIRTPKNGCDLVDLFELDLILIPGLAFDRRANRLGRGAGFYDRLISKLDRDPSSSRPQLVGVCYQCQIVDHVPIEPHDYPMDRIITQLGQQVPN